jgi:hypothetical protein
MKTPDMIEGPEAWERFKRGMKALMVVPRSEVLPHEKKLREEISKNPNRPGPKTKKR